MAESEKNTITIEGTEYAVEDLSENARKIIVNIQFADQEIGRQRLMLASIQTARQAYAQALKRELGGENGETEVVTDPAKN
ncbi:DUF6447 family protein [Shimia abyssi]|uniref:Uncharacterized protein n=1 Tax=Shimia abyssi TaxID=1662395 RepID=A0A2P8F772_9RHOB|nr:DUF6447 family protein [Shimia abyssi]PSL17569.1 hypothetical protein CLV88_11616 [Shimia abyssi]